MARNSVLGLPIPNHPVDINAPRSSRKRPTQEGSGGEEFSDPLSSAPPNKLPKKGSGMEEQATPSTQVSTKPMAPKTSKKKGKGRKTKATLDTDATLQPVPNTTTMAAINDTTAATPALTAATPVPTAPAPALTAPTPALTAAAPALTAPVPALTAAAPAPTVTLPALPKNRKGKSAAQPIQDSNAEMSQPARETSTGLVSIIVGDSIVPPDQSQIDTTDTAGHTPQDVRASTCTKTTTTLAKKVLKQESDKIAKQQARERRKIEKAQKRVVQELPEATAAFLETTTASGSAPQAHNNIEISAVRQPQPGRTGDLQRIRQNETNMLIAQRAASRFLDTPPLSSTSASGSEGFGTIPNLHRPSTSRASSSAPSAYSAPISSTHSVCSRTLSSHPPTLTEENTGPVFPSGSTLAECYDEIPEEFAPRLPAYDPLPPPLREPERLRPVPYKDINLLSGSDRKEYLKACKLRVKDLTVKDHIIVSSVLSRLDALINTIDCFPSDEDAWHMMQVSNAWGCRKHNLGNLILVKGSPYEELLASRLSQTKTGIVECAVGAVAEAYAIKTQNLTPELIKYNQETVAYWLHEGNFTCPPTDFGALYERPVIENIINRSFFQKHVSVGVAHRDLFNTIPIPLIAGVAAALQKALLEYETGVFSKKQFTRSMFRPKWSSHVGSLCDMFKSPEGHRLVKHLRGLGTRLLAPYPAMSNNMTTVVAPMIPSITSRYGRSITAPPPPAPPGLPTSHVDVLLAAPSSILPSSTTDRPAKSQKKAKSAKRSAATNPASVPVSPAIAAPPAESAPVHCQPWTEVEPEQETYDELRVGASADVGDPTAWAESVQAYHTPVAQYDALHTLVQSDGFEDANSAGATFTAPEGDADENSVDETSDDSAGKGDSGDGQLAKRGANTCTSDDGTSDSEDEDDES